MRSAVLYTLDVCGVPAVDIRRVGGEEEILRFPLVDLGWERLAHMSEHVCEGQGSGISILQVAKGNRDRWWANQLSFSITLRPMYICAQPYLSSIILTPSTAFPPIATSHQAGISSPSPLKARWYSPGSSTVALMLYCVVT